MKVYVPEIRQAVAQPQWVESISLNEIILGFLIFYLF